VGPGCTESCGGGTLTEDCMTTSNGYVVTEVISLTFTPTGGMGDLTIDVETPDGGLFENCSYLLTITKE
jgi:hypothetical protein